MNVIASPATSVPSTVLAINPLASEQEVSNLRALLEEAEKKASADRLAATVAAHEALRGKIDSIPGLLGVTDMNAALTLIVEELGLDPLHAKTRTLRPAPKAKRGFPQALPAETLVQMKAMLEAGSTSRAVAEALGVGISTVDSRKAKWGLTNKGLGGHPAKSQRAPRVRKAKARKGGTHIPPERRAKIVEAIRKETPIAVISRRYGISRQGAYDIKHKLEAAA